MQNFVSLASGYYKLDHLKALPVLEQGHTDNLMWKGYDIFGRAARVWISRMTKADGAKYDNGVTVESHVNGAWKTMQRYEAR